MELDFPDENVVYSNGVNNQPWFTNFEGILRYDASAQRSAVDQL